MSKILYEDDKVCIREIHDNALAVESKISDPAEVAVSVDADKVESNLGKVRFDLRRSDGVHEEYAYVMGRLTADKQEGALYFAVRKRDEQQAREILYMDPNGIVSQVPIIGANTNMGIGSQIKSPNGQLLLATQDDENLVLYLNGKPIRALFGLSPDKIW